MPLQKAPKVVARLRTLELGSGNDDAGEGSHKGGSVHDCWA